MKLTSRLKGAFTRKLNSYSIEQLERLIKAIENDKIDGRTYILGMNKDDCGCFKAHLYNNRYFQTGIDTIPVKDHNPKSKFEQYACLMSDENKKQEFLNYLYDYMDKRNL